MNLDSFPGNIMRIEIDNLSGEAKIINPSFGSKDFYLNEKVVNSLRVRGVLNRLENMKFILDVSRRIWEISDEPPVGKYGTVASILFSMRGTLDESKGNRVVCLL